MRSRCDEANTDSCDPDDPISDAIDLIATHRLNELFVLDADGLVSVVNRFDVMQMLTHKLNV
ncbi:MAG TPA: CBS domain-containing protein [Dehalococcoidia bacterium]|nr:CBS domain-containing protein [Dehalococcoidia bacterium]HIK99037.1 CBS domain-containing protein [Dehalococcoidia bacterium]